MSLLRAQLLVGHFCVGLMAAAFLNTVTLGQQPSLPALAEIKLAAERGDPLAQQKLGDACLADFDFAQAEHWYREAAAKGVADAQWQLGMLWLTGKPKMRGAKPVEKNSVEAVKLLSQAAHQGHQRAQLELGHCYRDGKAVPIDLVEAYKWYQIAAQQDAMWGRMYRDPLILRLTSDQVAEGQRRAAAFRLRKAGGIPSSVSSVASELRLEGVMGFKDRRQAVINKRIFSVGDEQNLWMTDRTLKLRCLEISDDSVLVKVIDGSVTNQFRLRRQ
ncbi:MAG: tetratricopeptide repeat protein [Verrucomicrobiota bacterium]